MNEFTASNGVRISVTEQQSDGKKYLLGKVQDPAFEMTGGVTHATASEEGLTALREFFVKERDDELGRWRWPENPDYVVYASGDRVIVVDEFTGDSSMLWRGERLPEMQGLLTQATRAYFDAHPEPKPWHEAKPGEVWVVTVDWSEDIACTVTSSGPDFEPVQNPVWATIARGSDRITAARRIWPEST